MPISDKIKARIEAAKKKHSSEGRFFYLEKDKPVRVHILPGEFGEDKLFYNEVGLHYMDNEDNSPFTCPRITKGEHCPICEQIEHLREAEAELKQVAEEEGMTKEIEEQLKGIEGMISDLYPSRKFLLNVLEVGSTNPKVFTAPKTIFEKVFELFVSNYQDDNDILNPNESYIFELKKEGSGQYNTSYSATILLKPKPIADSESSIQSILDNAADLDKAYKKIDPDALRQAAANYMGDDSPKSEPETEPEPEPEPKTESVEESVKEEPKEDPKSSSMSGSAAAMLKKRLEKK